MLVQDYFVDPSFDERFESWPLLLARASSSGYDVAVLEISAGGRLAAEVDGRSGRLSGFDELWDVDAG